MKKVNIPLKVAIRQIFLAIIGVESIKLIIASISFVGTWRDHLKQNAIQATCMSNQRQIITAIQMYAQDHQYKLPDSYNIWDTLYIDCGVLYCPKKGVELDQKYGYNQAMSGHRINEIVDPANTLVTSDHSLYNNKDWGLKTVTDIDPCHEGKCVSSYIDGHVAAALVTPNMLAVRYKKHTDITR